MIPGFTPAESAVAACIVDDLADREAAKAAGIGLHLYRKHARRLRSRFGVASRQSLRLALFDCERADLRALDACEFGPLSDGAPARAPAHSGEAA